MHDALTAAAQAAPSTGICTLFERDYHFGLAALINSLVHADYVGTVWAGYRGALPPWLGQLTRLDAAVQEYLVTEQVRLVLVPLDTALHFANYKPQFMLDLLAGSANDCKYLWYFDPDICLQRSWLHFAKWQRHGIAVCEEIVSYGLSENDPLRLQWAEIGTEMGLREPRAINRYFNSGMVGISPDQADFLHLWKRIIEYADDMGCDLNAFMPGNRELPFYAVDQDALNMALMFVRHPLSTMGPEGMGFTPGNPCVYHSVGQKPWRGSMLLRALSAIPPSRGIKHFYTQVSTPICAYPPWILRAKQLECSIAALIGRFYRRT